MSNPPVPTEAHSPESSERMPESFALRGAAVVVVHGLWMPRAAMAFFGRGLSAAGLEPHAFGYPSRAGTLAANAQRLAEFTARVAGSTVHFVGHSLGGVVILTMLARYGSVRPGRVVCLGSPLAGSLAADRLARTRAGRWFIGKSMVDVAQGRGPSVWSGPAEVGVIAGDVAFGAGRAVAALAFPNDGTVAVEETRLEGISDHLVMPVSHFSLLWSKAVIRQTALFLANGEFRRSGDDEPTCCNHGVGLVRRTASPGAYWTGDA